MNVRHQIVVVVATLLLSSATAWATITSDYDHNARFNDYKTYSWGKVQTPNDLWNERVKEAINGQLAAKGWTEMPSGGEVVVSARNAIHNRQQLETFYDGFGGWRRFGGFGMSTTDVENYKVGTLVVDMFDSQSRNLIWRGAASDTLSNNADKNIKSLDKNVHKMFERFPPEQKK